MLSRPWVVCFRLKFSSGKVAPYIDSPPLPFRLVKSFGAADRNEISQIANHTIVRNQVRTASLTHESFNDTVENGAAIMKWHVADLSYPHFTSTKGTEVLCGLLHLIGKELHDNSPN